MKITKTLQEHLEKLKRVKRKHLHPLVHHIHKKHNISKKTLLYVKEYGQHSHVAKTIIKESVKILLLASLISSFGGLALENIKVLFVSILPLVILLPSLNNMIGSYGTIISSRFSTMLHENKIKGKPLKNKQVIKMFLQIVIVAIIAGLLSIMLSFVLSYFSGYQLTKATALKIMVVSLADILMLALLMFLVAVFAGLYFYRKKEDPDNFLIPLTTSVADFANMLILAALIVLFF